MTDNAWSYNTADASPTCSPSLGATHKFIKPHCPWQNGKVERFNRTLQTEWAYRQVFTTNDERTQPSHPGSTTTTTDDATAPSEACHPSAACHQPDGRVQLAGRPQRPNARDSPPEGWCPSERTAPEA